MPEGGSFNQQPAYPNLDLTFNHMFHFILKGPKQLGMGSKDQNICQGRIYNRERSSALSIFYLFFQVYHLLLQLAHSSFLAVSGSLGCYSVFQFPENRRGHTTTESSPALFISLFENSASWCFHINVQYPVDEW